MPRQIAPLLAIATAALGAAALAQTPRAGLRPDPLRARQGPRHRLRHRLEPHAPPPSARDDGRRRRRSSTTTTTACSTSTSTNGATMTGLDKSDPRFWNRLYRNLGNWKFEDVTEKAGVKGTGYDLGVTYARLRQRRLPRPVRRRPAPQHALPQQRRRHVRGRQREGRLQQAGPRVRDAVVRGGRLLRLRQRRQARPVRLELLRLGPEDRAALRPARDERLLPPEQLQGPAQLALPQQRRRHLHATSRRRAGSAS